MSQEDEITLADDGGLLEAAVRNWLASILVRARDGCVWAANHLNTHEDVEDYRQDGFLQGRILSAAFHWRWVFCNSDDHALPFSFACEELGLSEHSVRRRILAQCSPNRDINKIVDRVLKENE